MSDINIQAITDGALQKHSIGISPLRHPTELPPLPATAFTIRLWARFAYSAKASLFRRLLSFPTKLCFAGALNCYPLGLWLSRSIIMCTVFVLYCNARLVRAFFVKVQSKFFIYCYHNSETIQFLICFKKFLKKLFDIIFSLKLIITAKGCFTPYLSEKIFLYGDNNSQR